MIDIDHSIKKKEKKIMQIKISTRHIHNLMIFYK